MDTPRELLETPRGSPMASTDVPAVTQPDEQEPHPKGPGTELEDQIPKGARAFPPLPKRSSNNGGMNAEEEVESRAEPLAGPSLTTRDWGDEAVGTTDLQQDTDSGVGKPEPTKDHAAKSSGGMEAGGRMQPAAEAAVMVLGKWGHSSAQHLPLIMRF